MRTSTTAGRHRNPWRSARTLADLGELTARWLEGDLDEVPGYGGPPDEETRPLVPALAALNRAGYVTIGSQPGETGRGVDGGFWEQRAAVDGLASGLLVWRIAGAAERAGLTVITHDPAGRPRWGTRGQAVPVTREDGEDCTWFGAQVSRHHLSDSWTGFGGCHRDAVRAVLRAYQVTVIDPEWGRPGLLWEVLSGVI